MKDPRQQSTCRPILAFFASLPKAGIGSYGMSGGTTDLALLPLTTAPSGKLGAEPTIMIVLMFLPVSVYVDHLAESDIHCSSHTPDICLSSLLIDGDDVKLDLEVFTSLPECCMGRCWDDPTMSEVLP